MKILETILSSAIVGLLMLVGSYFVGKKLVNNQKDEIFDEILDYLGSPEGQQSVQNLGSIFASGIAKGVGLGGSPLKGKTFGIPNTLLYEFMNRYMPKKTKEPISEKTQQSSSGKFDS